MTAITAPVEKLDATFVWADAVAMLRRDWAIVALLTAVFDLSPRLLFQVFVAPLVTQLAHGSLYQAFGISYVAGSGSGRPCPPGWAAARRG